MHVPETRGYLQGEDVFSWERPVDNKQTVVGIFLNVFSYCIQPWYITQQKTNYTCLWYFLHNAKDTRFWNYTWKIFEILEFQVICPHLCFSQFLMQ